MPSNGGSRAELTAILGVIGSIIAVLGFLGVRNFGQLMHNLASNPTPTASPVPTSPYSPFPAPSVSPFPSPSTEPSPSTGLPSGTGPSPSSGVDLASLNSEATDQTPFTVGALLPRSFTDSEGVQYSLAASGSHACGGAAYVSANVQSVLDAYHCSTVMTADYLVSSGTVTYNNDVLVSVQVMPLTSSLAAQNVFASFPSDGQWDFGIWCPTTGAGSGDCSNGYQAAQRYDDIQWKHRYLIEATAVYVDLTSNSSAQPYLKSAAIAAVDASGPENYSGNQP